MRPSAVAALVPAFLSVIVLAQEPAPTPSQASSAKAVLIDAQIEDFLLHAKVIKTHRPARE